MFLKASGKSFLQRKQKLSAVIFKAGQTTKRRDSMHFQQICKVATNFSFYVKSSVSVFGTLYLQLNCLTSELGHLLFEM